MIYIEPFNDGQITDVLRRRLGEIRGLQAASFLLNKADLAAMARKPVLIEFLLAAIDETAAESLRSPAYVYLHATNKLLLRNITNQKTFTSTRDKLFFLCELAWEMLRNQELRVHYSEIPDRIQAYFGERIRNPHELDNWDFDLRNQTLLHRDASGYYEFAHKSLAEYFVALKFACELGCLAWEFKATYVEEGGSIANLPYELKTIKELAETFAALRFGRDGRVYAVRTLMAGMLDQAGISRLWLLLNDCRNLLGGYAASNIVSLLTAACVSFEGADLSSLVLGHASLPRELRNASLRGSLLDDVDLQGCDLRGSDLTGARVGAGCLTGADLRGVIGDVGPAAFFLEPTRPRAFDQQAFLDLVKAMRDRHPVCCLIGPPGAGKTSVMAELYYSTPQPQWAIDWTEGEFTRLFRDEASSTYKLEPFMSLATYFALRGYDELSEAVQPLRKWFIESGSFPPVSDTELKILIQHTRRAVESEAFCILLDDFKPNQLGILADFFVSFPHKSNIILSSTYAPENLDERVQVIKMRDKR